MRVCEVSEVEEKEKLWASKGMPGCTPGLVCAREPLCQSSQGLAWPSGHELWPILFQPLLLVGAGLAGTQTKHLRLIRGTNGAWVDPSARVGTGGKEGAPGTQSQTFFL